MEIAGNLRMVQMAMAVGGLHGVTLHATFVHRRYQLVWVPSNSSRRWMFPTFRWPQCLQGVCHRCQIRRDGGPQHRRSPAKGCGHMLPPAVQSMTRKAGTSYTSEDGYTTH